jgi:hypothetical protein
MAGGGHSGGITSFLPIAAALAATVATDGAASPWLVEAMGSEAAAGAVMGAGAGALGGGITAAVTGQNVGRSALMGGISGATLGYGMAPADAAVGTATTAASTAPALTGTNVAGTAAMTPAELMGTPMTGSAFTLPESGAFTPSAIGYGGTATDPISGLNAMNGSNWWTEAAPQVTPSDMVGINNTAVDTNAQVADKSSGIGDWLSKNKGIATIGGTALLGALVNKSNQQYGVPSTSSQQYNGPLTDFHYSRQNYTPLTTPQPNPAYQAKYANYVAHPYNAYAAEGGQVVSMAAGGIAGAAPTPAPINPPAGGAVEQMSRDNALGQNQMFPQAAIHTDAYASPTNRPFSQDMIASASDTNVDPYTGAEKFAEGGIANTPEAQQPQQIPQGIAQQITPNAITQNSVNTNNALAQDLISRMAARNAANPVPGQTPPVAPVAPAGIAAASPYAAPTFTRPTDVAPIPFQNPKIIVGTKEYNDEQARLAAEAEAKRQAEAAATPITNPYDYGGGGGAAGGLMPGALRYAGGGKTTSNMAAIDEYMAQYQSDPASVAAKARAGDWNAMIAMNKIHSTPNQNYAHGGNVSSLGGYAAGGNPRLLKGPGDGMSDNIPATIGGKQPARLADGEFVVPADVVSHLGNGSTDAGAKHLYNMMDKVRKARTGNKKQGKQIKADKFLKA